MPDPSNGQAPILGSHQSTCPKCLSVGFYDGEKIERHQHPEQTDQA